MFIEKTKRKLLRFDLNEREDLEDYNRYLQDPSVKVIDKEVLVAKESSYDGEHSLTEDHHICYLEVEECSF